MNQVIEWVKINNQRRLANVCELASDQLHDYYVGGNQCANCKYFVRKFPKDGKLVIHCDHTKAANSK